MGAEETFFRKIGNFFHFFHKVENSENLFIRAYKCAKFQEKIFFEKKWHPSSGILSKNFQFSNLKSNLFGNFSTFSTNSKIPKIYLSGPISVQSFRKKYFLKKTWHPSSRILSKNFQFSNLKSDLFGKFSTFQLSRKFGNFIYFGLHVCKVSAKSKKLFFFIHPQTSLFSKEISCKKLRIPGSIFIMRSNKLIYKGILLGNVTDPGFIFIMINS